MQHMKRFKVRKLEFKKKRFQDLVMTKALWYNFVYYHPNR